MEEPGTVVVTLSKSSPAMRSWPLLWAPVPMMSRLLSP